MSNDDDWCTIESDPGVFTSLVESFGTRNVEFAELWSLDDDSLASLTRPIDGINDASVHGLIFLFKWQRRQDPSSTSTSNGDGTGGGGGEPLTGDDVPHGLFFARQTTHNACATQAILSVLLNARNSIIERDVDDDAGGGGGGGGEGAEVEEEKDDDDNDRNGRRLVLGRMLSDFRSFTSHFPPDLRGEAIGVSESIRSAHNSFGRAEDAFLMEDGRRPRRNATDDDDVFHFVAYVPHEHDRCVYELDGLKDGPVRVGSYDGTVGGGGGGGEGGEDVGDAVGWLRVARDAIRDRLDAYSSSEIKFNLMALVQDRRTCLCEKLDALVAIGIEESDPAMLSVRTDLLAEEEKRSRWRMENERRRHNYLPFSVEFLRCLVGCGKFDKLINMARKNAGEKRKRSEAWKKSMVDEGV
jgi:ubiquitin carboxyl-terminal hydrolase L5